jgi:single-strand DNA-binding protein
MGYFLNRATIIGNITENLELKYTNGGIAVCRFGVATNRRVKKKGTEEYESIATFHKVVVWGKTAEWASNSFSKGQKIYIEGRIDSRTYDDRDGKKVFISEIVADEIIQFNKSNQNEQRDNTPTVEQDTTDYDFGNLDFDLDNPEGVK